MKTILTFLFSILFFLLPVYAAEVPAGASSNFAEVNGIRVHYIKMGDGPLLVLLHGWPETSYEWRRVMPSLAAGFTVVAPDLRGTGETERTAAGYEKRTIAEDTAALIRYLGFDKAAIVGHDMGGKAAYVLARVHPELVDKLVLVDCSPPGSENMDPANGGSWHYGFHMAADFPEMLTKGREKEYLAAQVAHWLHAKDAISAADIAEYARHYASPGGMTAGFNYYRTLLEDGKFVASLPSRKLSMPVLAIGGRFSGADKLYKLLLPQTSNLTGVVAEQSGHFVPEEEPAFFAEQVRRFLKK